MKVLIYGNGWIGNLLNDYLNAQGWLSVISKNRIFQVPLVILEEEIRRYDVVINCAAKTNIDWCELNKFETVESNVLLPRLLAKLCKDWNKQYVLFSSACIFESKGTQDFKFEDSKPSPACFYTETKIMAEKLVQEILPSTIIIRPRLPLSEKPHAKNTINKIKGYTRLHKNQESVTVVEDMLPVVKELIEKKESGVFHLINEGTISPAQIADWFGVFYEVIDKATMDNEMVAAGRARRVTTLVGSKRIPYLPPIQKRMDSLSKAYAKK